MSLTKKNIYVSQRTENKLMTPSKYFTKRAKRKTGKVRCLFLRADFIILSLPIASKYNKYHKITCQTRHFQCIVYFTRPFYLCV